MKRHPLDPLEHLDHMAVLSARLAAPFAVRADVLGDAGVASRALEAAQIRWAERLQAAPDLVREYRRAYAEEAARLRGEPETDSPRAAQAAPAPAAAPPPPPPPPAVASAATADETAFLPRPVIREALPFQKGSFKPEPIPLASPPAPPETFDPDGTLPLPRSDDPEPSLPFVKMLPSQSHKKSNR